MKATAKSDMVLITAEHILDGELVVETNCKDYLQYSILPDVIMYKNVILGKTGFSSDSAKCCYKSNVKVAGIISKRSA